MKELVRQEEGEQRRRGIGLLKYFYEDRADATGVLSVGKVLSGTILIVTSLEAALSRLPRDHDLRLRWPIGSYGVHT